MEFNLSPLEALAITDPDDPPLLRISIYLVNVVHSYRLDSGGGIRVGDFGLAEDVYASGYFRQNDRANVKLPYKWMALESLNDAIFTEKTDVVSHAVQHTCMVLA